MPAIKSLVPCSSPKTAGANVAFSCLLLSFSPVSQQLGDFGCFGGVDGPVGIKDVAFWLAVSGQKPAVFGRHLFENPLRYIFTSIYVLEQLNTVWH